MATIESYTMSKDDLENNADVVKITILAALVREGLLNYELADQWCASHAVVLKKKSFFRTLSNLWTKQEAADSLFFVVVKTVSHPPDKGEKDDDL